MHGLHLAGGHIVNVISLLFKSTNFSFYVARLKEKTIQAFFTTMPAQKDRELIYDALSAASLYRNI